MNKKEIEELQSQIDSKEEITIETETLNDFVRSQTFIAEEIANFNATARLAKLQQDMEKQIAEVRLELAKRDNLVKHVNILESLNQQIKEIDAKLESETDA